MPSDGDANSGATVSAIAPSASIMASSFMCNVSLPPKLKIHSGNSVEAMATSMGCLRRGDRLSN